MLQLGRYSNFIFFTYYVRGGGGESDNGQTSPKFVNSLNNKMWAESAETKYLATNINQARVQIDKTECKL